MEVKSCPLGWVADSFGTLDYFISLEWLYIFISDSLMHVESLIKSLIKFDGFYSIYGR